MNDVTKLVRTIEVETKILSADGTVDYVAADQTVDRDREIIRVKGIKVHNLKKNMPFLDSHRFDSVEHVLGKVIDARVEGDRLIERVKYAVDVPENKRARLAYKMAEAGYSRAVSIGGQVIKRVSRFDEPHAFKSALQEMGFSDNGIARHILLEMEQTELSAVTVGANPNALALVAKGYKDGVISDEEIEMLSKEYAKSACGSHSPADDLQARQRGREEFIKKLVGLVGRV